MSNIKNIRRVTQIHFISYKHVELTAYMQDYAIWAVTDRLIGLCHYLLPWFDSRHTFNRALEVA